MVGGRGKIVILSSLLVILISGLSFYAPDVKAVTLHSTMASVTPNPASTVVGQPITFEAKITDISSGLKTNPTGVINWNDGGAGGSFNATTCSLSNLGITGGKCFIKYTSPPLAGIVTINATYGGDSTHSVSSGVSKLTVNLRDSVTVVNPNPAFVVKGHKITFSVKVAGTGTGKSSNPTGMVTWNDGGAGGSFASSSSCTLAPLGTTLTSKCFIVYTAPSSTGSVTITANYPGDGSHKPSSGKATLTVSTKSPTTTTVTPNPVTIHVGVISTFHATVVDMTSSSPTNPTGKVVWDDGTVNMIGGPPFNQCILAPVSGSSNSSACDFELIANSQVTFTYTMTGTYGGDSTHVGSQGSTKITVIGEPD